MKAYETKWGQLREAVQDARPVGTFKTSVTVVSGQLVYSDVASQTMYVWVVLAVEVLCGCSMSIAQPPTAMFNIMAATSQNSMASTDPSTNIIRQNGLCADLYKGNYKDGNPVVLWTCGHSTNQLWISESDDNTIRCNGKCLTTFGYFSQADVIIYDCDKADSDATKWEILSGGTIRNIKSGQVLTGFQFTPGLRTKL
ncbi:ricin-like [Hibiscus syriacus]|uniref:ricin-like n=1 Tax=Hibiscus syriacus TaxID=106335 RepID=UPI00192312CD|nr:ricin-like [Hibiscus syriacus]